MLTASKHGCGRYRQGRTALVVGRGSRARRHLRVVAVGAERRTPFDCTEAFPDFGPAYCSHIVGSNFGLRHVGQRQNPARIGPVSIPAPTGVTTEAEAEETRVRVRRRIGELVGHPVDSVEVRRMRYRARFDTGGRERLEVLDRRAFSLRRGEAW